MVGMSFSMGDAMAEEKQKYYCTVIDPKRRNGAFVDGSKQREMPRSLQEQRDVVPGRCHLCWDDYRTVPEQ